MLDDLTVGMSTCDDDVVVLRRALERVLAEPLARAPVVVDMSRTSAIRELASSFDARLRDEHYESSTGLSDSRNRLVELAETRYLLMLDADAVPEAGWAVSMRAAFDRQADAAVIGGRCLPEWTDGHPRLFTTAPALDFLGMFDLGDEPVRVPRAIGTTFTIDLERIPADPPFATELGRRPDSLLGHEEIAYCLGVQSKGWSVWYEPTSVVRHHVRPGRASWPWMQRRAFVAGQESCLSATRLEPLPRRMTPRDRVFLAAIAPMYLAGRLRGPKTAAGTQGGDR